jgi:tetratricopeptide (TPR) repeat protein
MRHVWVFAVAMLVAPCAAQRLDDIDSLISRGELERAESIARAGGDSTRAWLAEVLVLRGKLNEATQVLSTTNASRAIAIKAELAARRGEPDSMFDVAAPLIEAWRREGATWSAEDLISVGRVLRLVGRHDPDAVRESLRAFDAAIQVDPNAVEALVRSSELFLERYNAPDAVEGYSTVLSRRPDDTRAMVGKATAASFAGSGGAMGQVRDALAVDPNSVAALLLMSQLYLEAEQYDSSAVAVDRALALDSSRVDVWAARASLAWLADDTTQYRVAEEAASDLSRIPAEFYAKVAAAAGRHRRYSAAAEIARRGVQIDSTSVAALGELGTNLLRTGVMAEGRAALERAFALDPFHLWHKNTLDLLDELEQFVTISTPRFEFVATPDDAAILATVLGPLMETAYESLAVRYNYRPPTPIRMELYDRHADFSVRTIGLAGLGALGVSFGTLLVMDAPDARPPGEFNLGSTAWHELAHTFTLGLSENRVPRWFSEGLSVLEERRARPGWGAHASLHFVHSLATDSLLPISRLNDGFVRPDSPGRIGLSYYQASLVVELLEEQVGIEGIRAMLLGYAAGENTESVLTRVTGAPVARFDSTFFAWVDGRFEEPVSHVRQGDPTVFSQQMSSAMAAMEAGDTSGARTLLEVAASRFPEYGDDDGPHLPLSILLWSTGKKQEALQSIARVTRTDESALGANTLEATWRLEVADTVGALEALERALWIAPYDRQLWLQKAELAESIGLFPSEVIARRALVQLKPPDPVAARTDLAASLLNSGDVSGARQELRGILEDTPRYERAQELFGRAMSATARTEP